MSNIQPIPAEVRHSLLAKLSSLPEEEWLKLFSHADQQSHWLGCKWMFQILETALRAYFEGIAFPFPDLNSSDREFLQRQRDRWLLLYSLLHDGWSGIVDEAKAKGVESLLPGTPGEALIAILSDYAACQIWGCLPWATVEQGKFSASASHKLYREYLKLSALGENLTPEKRAVFNKKVKRSNVPRELTFRLDFCINVCEKLAKRDRLLRHRLKDWHRNQCEIDAEALRFTHPQRKIKGYQWVNGQKLLTCS